MFNEQLIEERRQMVLEQLIYDEIFCLREKKRKECNAEINQSIDKKIKSLESIYDNINDLDINLMNKSDKEIVIKLLEARISGMESERVETNNSDEDTMNKIVEFIIYEYKLLLKEFLVSVIKCEEELIRKNKN